MAKFYNPGFKWEELLKYDNPVADAREVNNVSYFRLRAPEKGVFEVPDTMLMKLATGEEIDVPLRFKKLIQSQYSDRGVVLIDGNGEEAEKAARKTAETQWKQYLHDKANEWIRIVHEVKAAGQIPRPAQGLFQRVLEELGMEDPADNVSVVTRAKEGQQENKELQRQIAEMQKQIAQLTGALSVRKTA